ncbi:MAG: FliG C-terminal domain-containing protein [Bdellovibrionota bacterium]
MGMVDRYKKAGGFLQLVQVIETCNQKKREQFMNIIVVENPEWADALNQKCISFNKIINWKIEYILEIVASVNTLSFSTALKSLSTEQLESFFQKVSHQDRKKFEISIQESTANPNEISASVVKVISETRNLFVQGSLKFDKVDPALAIPDGYEAQLGKNEQNRGSEVALIFDGPALNFNLGDSAGAASGGSPGAVVGGDVDKLQKRLTLLTKELQNLKTENQVMKDKLEKIKKIA